MQPINVGVVGLGYWGPNLARNFAAIPAAASSPGAATSPRPTASAAKASFPSARFTADLDDLLDDPEFDAVVLATPVPTHGPLAERVLRAGKHCYVEKPLAYTVEDAERAVAAAQQADRLLMVGHLLVYHPGVEMLKEIADSGELGDIHYIYSQRLNLGQLRTDENALWSLGAHDVSVILHLADEDPSRVEARGEAYMREGVEDVVFAFMRFPSGVAAHLHLSWLDPHKTRAFTVVGSKRMATFDDMELERKVTVYDKGFDEKAESYGEYITRSGDIRSPRIANKEPLRIECEHFVDCDPQRDQAPLRRRSGATRGPGARRTAGEPEGYAVMACWSTRSRAASEARPALGPDHLVAARADADQRDRHADDVRDVLQVVARVLRQLFLGAALGDVLVPARQLLVVAATHGASRSGGTDRCRTSPLRAPR